MIISSNKKKHLLDTPECSSVNACDKHNRRSKTLEFGQESGGDEQIPFNAECIKSLFQDSVSTYHL